MWVELNAQKALIKKSTDDLDFIGGQVSNQVSVEIKKATAHLRTSALESDANGPKVSALVLTKISKKADKSDLDALFNLKASKTDSEMALRQIDIIHKQLKQIALLITQKFRQSLETVGNESQHQKANKKVNLLHQALLIS